MRSLIMIVCCLLAAPSFAQEVFRALPIDDEQNERLDVQEQKINELSQNVSQLAATVDKLVSMQMQKPKPVQVVQQPVRHVQQMQPVRYVEQQPTFVPQSNRYSPEELLAIAKQAYPDERYYIRNSSVNPPSAVWRHLKSGDRHSFEGWQVDSLPQWAALAIHDLEHGGQISPFRPQNSRFPASQPQPAYSVAVSANVATGPMPAAPQPQYEVGCANGQCARVQVSNVGQARSSRRGGGLLGFGILGG